MPHSPMDLGASWDLAASVYGLDTFNMYNEAMRESEAQVRRSFCSMAPEGILEHRCGVMKHGREVMKVK